MAKIGLPKGSRKRLKVREKSVKSQGILKWILSGNPAKFRPLGQPFHPSRPLALSLVDWTVIRVHLTGLGVHRTGHI